MGRCDTNCRRGFEAETRKLERDRCLERRTLLPGFRKPQESTLYAVSTWTERLEVYGYLVCVKHYVRVRNRLYTRVQLGTCAYKVTRKKVSNSFPVLSTIPDTNSSHNFGMIRFFFLFFSQNAKCEEFAREIEKNYETSHRVRFKERIFFSTRKVAMKNFLVPNILTSFRAH